MLLLPCQVRLDMGNCISTMDPRQKPGHESHKARRSRPAPLQLGMVVKRSQRPKHRPPTPYPWRLRPVPTLGPRASVASTSARGHQSTMKARCVHIRHGRPRLIHVHAGGRSQKPSSKSQQSSKGCYERYLGSTKNDQANTKTKHEATAKSLRILTRSPSGQRRAK